MSTVSGAVVIDISYSSQRSLRLPWPLSVCASEAFSLDLLLRAGAHRPEVIADSERHILEEPRLQQNNRMQLDLLISA